MLRAIAFGAVLAALVVPSSSTADVPVQLIWEFSSGGHHIRCVSFIEDQEGYVPARPDVLVEIDNTGAPDGHLKLLRDSDGFELWGESPPGGVSGGCGYGDMCLSSAPDLSGDGFYEALLGTAWGGRTAYALLADDGGRIFWWFDTYVHDPPSGWVYSIDWINDVSGDGVPEIIFGCGSDNNNAYCVDGRSGAMRWRFIAPDAVYQVASIGDVNGNGTDDVLIGTGDTYADYTYCVDGGVVGNATYLWRFYVGATTYSVARIDDVDDDGIPDALIGTWDASGNVYCVSGADGSEIWRHGLGSYQYVMRVIQTKDLDDDGYAEVLVASWDNAIICLSGKTGDVHWSVPTGSTNGGDVWAIWPLGDVDYDGYPDVIAGSFDLKAYCVSGHTGAVLWDYTVGNRVYTVRGGGDLNGDQVADAVVGTQYMSGGGKVFALDADGDATGIAPISDLAWRIEGEAVRLSWEFDAAAGATGFNVYRMPLEERVPPEVFLRGLEDRGPLSAPEILAERAGEGRGGGFVRLNGDLVEEPFYVDSSVVDGARYVYMVGAVSPDGAESYVGPVEVFADLRSSALWLSPPTPNPSAGASTLSFAAPGGGRARAAVYSPSGRLVRRLEFDGGALVWDGLSDCGVPVAPGVYLVRLESGGEAVHRKVVRLR